MLGLSDITPVVCPLYSVLRPSRRGSGWDLPTSSDGIFDYFLRSVI